MTRPPLCEAIIQHLIDKSDPLRDSANAGMIHVSAVIELVREGFASLSVEEVHSAIEGEGSCLCPSCSGKAQAVMKLLRKE